MKRVVILETQLKHYRENFVTQLASTLRERGVSLVVGYSDPSNRERDKADTVELSSALGVKLPLRTWWNDRIVLQLAWRLVRDADLVIVGQGNGLLFNYLLIALSQLGVKRVAYWGHGFNHQAERHGVLEWVKRKLVSRVDGWFAYTPKVAQYLIDHGVAASTITTVHNTIDVGELATAVSRVDVSTARAELGLGATSRIGLYCGALGADKQLGFLADAAAEIRRLVPEFELLVVGDGCERAMLAAVAKYRPFIHVWGPAFGIERARYFAIADVVMVPAHVGLAIVDAFASGVPIATTDRLGHGPELEYLTPGGNGIITPFDVDVYAAEVARLICDPPTLRELRRGARESAAHLSMQRMVDAFADGIMNVLA